MEAVNQIEPKYAAMKLTEDSIISYARDKLKLRNICELRSPAYILSFLDLILEEEAKDRFSKEQYFYAAALIMGHKARFQTKEEAIIFLQGVRNEYSKLNELNMLIYTTNLCREEV